MDSEAAYRFCLEEAFSLEAYKALAEMEKDAERKKILERLAEDEERHYEFWKGLVGGDCRPPLWKMWLVKISYALLGPLFTIKLLEKGEEEAIRAYSLFAEKASGDLKQSLADLIRDEETHERELINILSDPRLKYLGSIALGLADAVVEITGVNAGFLGATENATTVGLAGLIVGFSAALSMAGASYLQSKHEKRASPIKSSAATGLAYIVSVLLLVAPFFAIASVIVAFAASIAISVLLTAFFTYYSSTIEDRDFKKEFAESVGLLLGIALAGYLLGAFLSEYFGVPKGT